MRYSDIVIIGAGPGGSVAAIALAQRGYRVTLLQRPRPYPALEGLAERAVAGLRHIGCERALASLNEQAVRQACWGGQSFRGNLEWLVDRQRFDQALLQDARAAGIEVPQAGLTGFERAGKGWRLHLADTKEFTAEFIVDARGRAAPQEDIIRGPATTALSQRWHLSRQSLAQTLIQPYAEGWAWLALSGQGWGILQMFLSTEQKKLPPKAKLTDYYQGILANLPLIQQELDGAAPEGPVYARFAQPQYNQPIIADGYARVGDAAFSIDPLSGHGVYFAIGGALAAAAAVHTILSKPENTQTAEQFYRERIADDFWRMARIGRDFYQHEQSWPESPFWRERQKWPDQQPAHAEPSRFKPSIEKRPVNADGLIELRDVIVCADHPRGIWQVAGIELVSLLRCLQVGGSIDDPAQKTAQAWLTARGLL